jgi:hypothetical protein
MKLRVGTKTSRTVAAVVDLADARDDRRLRGLHARLHASLESNKRNLGRLFQSGLLYTRAGARLGRDLLLAHQQLLELRGLVTRAEQAQDRSEDQTGPLCRHIEAVLDRAVELGERSDGMLERDGG